MVFVVFATGFSIRTANACEQVFEFPLK